MLLLLLEVPSFLCFITRKCGIYVFFLSTKCAMNLCFFWTGWWEMWEQAPLGGPPFILGSYGTGQGRARCQISLLSPPQTPLGELGTCAESYANMYSDLRPILAESWGNLGLSCLLPPPFLVNLITWYCILNCSCAVLIPFLVCFCPAAGEWVCLQLRGSNFCSYFSSSDCS